MVHGHGNAGDEMIGRLERRMSKVLLSHTRFLFLSTTLAVTALHTLHEHVVCSVVCCQR